MRRDSFDEGNPNCQCIKRYYVNVKMYTRVRQLSYNVRETINIDTEDVFENLFVIIRCGNVYRFKKLKTFSKVVYKYLT